MALLEPYLPGELPTFTLVAIRDGAQGTRDTLHKMAIFARAYKSNPIVWNTARQIVAHVPEKSPWDDAQAIQDWVRNHVRYTADIGDVETVQTPLVTLDQMMGDCDDQATLVASFLRVLGRPARFIAWAFNAPDQFEHVVTETFIGNRWVSVETTEPVGLGWTPESFVGFMVENV